jgi:hypothetical protein
MRPITNLRYETVLHWIVVNVIDMPCVVFIVSYGVFPITPLPPRKLSASVSLDGHPGREQPGAKVPLYPPPTSGEICVSRRQGKDRAKVVRQDHDRIDGKRTLAPRYPKCPVKGVEMIHKRCRMAVFEPQCKEEGSTGKTVTPVSNHS